MTFHHLRTRGLAILLVIAMILPQCTFLSSIVTAIGEDSKGVGVINTLYSSEEKTINYTLKFYHQTNKEDAEEEAQYSEIKLNDEFNVGDTYVTAIGKFALGKEQRICFNDSEAFNEFVKKNDIDKITIAYDDLPTEFLRYTEKIHRNILLLRKINQKSMNKASLWLTMRNPYLRKSKGWI